MRRRVQAGACGDGDRLALAAAVAGGGHPARPPGPAAYPATATGRRWPAAGSPGPPGTGGRRAGRQLRGDDRQPARQVRAGLLRGDDGGQPPAEGRDPRRWGVAENRGPLACSRPPSIPVPLPITATLSLLAVARKGVPSCMPPAPSRRMPLRRSGRQGSVPAQSRHVLAPRKARGRRCSRFQAAGTHAEPERKSQLFPPPASSHHGAWHGLAHAGGRERHRWRSHSTTAAQTVSPDFASSAPRRGLILCAGRERGRSSLKPGFARDFIIFGPGPATCRSCRMISVQTTCSQALMRFQSHHPFGQRLPALDSFQAQTWCVCARAGAKSLQAL